jgi:GNAT superfamily N-acetyltransferase
MRFMARSILDADLPEIDHLLQLAYQRSHTFLPRLRRQRLLQPDGWFLVHKDDQIVGCGGITIMPPFSYIGLVATDPHYQHQGVASLVMDVLMDFGIQRGCSTILLDASASGRPLYERLGFCIEDEVAEWQCTTPKHLAPVMDELILCSFHHTDFADLVAFDAHGYGTDRERILAAYLADDPSMVRLIRDAAGQIQGYLLIQADHTAGPWLATSLLAAQKLLSWGLADYQGSIIKTLVSTANQGATALLTQAGFVMTRTLTHMRYGAPLDPMRRQVVFGQINLALG